MEAANNMEDSSLFMQWAMDTLLQEEEPAVDDVHWAMDTLLQEEDPAIDYRLKLTLNGLEKRAVRVALSNNFGFGGQNASLVFRAL